MKKMLAVVAIVAVLIVVYFIYLGQVSRGGNAPGLTGNALAPCPAKPNCVSSETSREDAHFIEPLSIGGTPDVEAMQNLGAVIEQLGGRLETSHDRYLAAVFTSSVFGFVDDVEFRVDADARVIHVRSASRVGRSDLGANRKRVELIRSRLQAVLGSSA